jgi:hypothetical protein
MKLILYPFITMLFSYISCHTSKDKNLPTKLRVITVITNFPAIRSNDGKLINITDSFKIFYYKDMVLYQLFPKKQIINTTVDKAGKVIDQKIIRSEIDFSNFIYKQNDSVGLYYDSINSPPQKLPIDSFITSKKFINFNFYDKKNDSLIESINNETLVEKYIPKIKFDQSYGDTTILYYSKRFKDIAYSLSKDLDSLKKSKLFKVQIKYNSQYYKGYNFKFPQREFLFEIQESNKVNSIDIIRFFEQFEKVHATTKL